MTASTAETTPMPEDSQYRVTTTPAPLLTVIIPSYNERDNVEPLCNRLQVALAGISAEVLFVDDSSDDTPEVIRSVARRSALPIRVLHRSGPDRVGGLGGAVMAGFGAARSTWVAVMDADLQHPPELLPELVAAAIADTDGSADGLANGFRRKVSTSAAGLAKALFPKKLAGCTDPMSGFFMVRRSVTESTDLRPDGFKILLEVLTRADSLRIREVPFTFAERNAGESKANFSQGLIYLRHLARLRFSGKPARMLGFLAIGASGIIPNLIAMWLLTGAGMNYLAATVISTAIALTWNFALTDLVLFRHRRRGHVMRRYAIFAGFNSVDIVLRVPLMWILVDHAGLGVMASTVISIGIVAMIRFVAVDRIIYREVQVLEHHVQEDQLSSEQNNVIDLTDGAADTRRGAAHEAA